MWIYCLICWIVGIFIGGLTATLVYISKSSHGILRIDDENPEKKLYSFEIDNLETLETLDHSTQIILKITRK